MGNRGGGVGEHLFKGKIAEPLVTVIRGPGSGQLESVLLCCCSACDSRVVATSMPFWLLGTLRLNPCIQQLDGSEFVLVSTFSKT